MLIVLCGLQFIRYTGCVSVSVSDQYFGDKPDPKSYVLVSVVMVLLYCSTWPFCDGLSASVGSTMY